MRFGGYFPGLNDRELKSLQFNCNFDDGDDEGDTGRGGFTGGRGSNVAERPQTAGERAFSTVGSKIGGALVSAATGSPLAGAAAGRGIERLTSGPVSVDLRTGQRFGGGGFTAGGGASGDAGDRNQQLPLGAQTFGGPANSGPVTIDGATGQVIPGAIGGAVSEELLGFRESLAEQQRQFDIGQQNLAPFREAGVGALEEQQARLGLLGVEAQQSSFDRFAESPGQKFLRERGERAVLRGASATGGLGGGNVQKALVQHGIGTAAQQEGEQFNRLAGISGTGQSTAVTQAQLGQQFAGDVGRLQTSAAESRASGLLAQEALQQQQATADSLASAQRRQQNIGLATTIGSAIFDLF